MKLEILGVCSCHALHDRDSIITTYASSVQCFHKICLLNLCTCEIVDVVTSQPIQRWIEAYGHRHRNSTIMVHDAVKDYQ